MKQTNTKYCHHRVTTKQVDRANTSKQMHAIAIYMMSTSMMKVFCSYIFFLFNSYKRCLAIELQITKPVNTDIKKKWYNCKKTDMPSSAKEETEQHRIRKAIPSSAAWGWWLTSRWGDGREGLRLWFPATKGLATLPVAEEAEEMDGVGDIEGPWWRRTSSLLMEVCESRLTKYNRSTNSN